MKVDAMHCGTHNPFEESHWVSRLRENFTGGSYGEGLETDRKVPRQSLTRQVFFKMAKQHLNLEREVQLRNYDGLVGHVTIVLSRYIFLAYEQRLQEDPRTLGSLFHACCSEMADFTMLEALYRLLMLVAEKFRSAAKMTDAYIESLLNAVMGKAIEMLHSSQGISGYLNEILASSLNPES